MTDDEMQAMQELSELFERVEKRRTYKHENGAFCWDCYLDQLLYGESLYDAITLEHYPPQDVVHTLAYTPRSGVKRAPFRSSRVEDS